MINIKWFDPRLLKINKLSFKGVFSVNIYYISYITMKLPDNVNIDDEDFLYLTFNNVDGYLMKNDGIKYLVFNSTDENKEALKKITQNFGKKIKSKLKQ